MTCSAKIIAVSLALGLTAWGDTVLTRDGRVLRGKITLGPDRAVSVSGQPIAVTNLLRALFTPDTTPPGLSGIIFRLYQGNWGQLPDFSPLPIDMSGRLSTNRLDLSPLGLQDSQRVFELQTGQTLSRWSAPKIERRPFAISATVVASGADGVIVAQGGNQDGYSLFLKDGHLCFALREKNPKQKDKKIRLLRDEQPLPRYRPVVVLAELRRDFTLRLHVDGREAAREELDDFVQQRPQEGLSVGYDQRPTPVAEYHGENHFQGTLTAVQVRLMGVGLVYQGNLQVPTDGEYQFELAADSPSLLEIDGNLLIDNGNPAKLQQPSTSAKLTAGTHTFRMVYAQLAIPKPLASGLDRREFLTLHWSGPGLPRQPLTAIPHPQAVTWRPDDTAIPSAGFLTRKGSFLSKPVETIDAKQVKIANQSLPRREISTVFLRPISIPEARKLAEKPVGLLLLDGTYIEGQLRTLDERKATISSIIFGVQNYLRYEQVAAIVLHRATAPATHQQFRLRDGSVILAEQYSVKDGNLLLERAPLTGQVIPLAQIAEMTHGKLPNPIQAATAYWQLHSELGQQFLGARDKEVQGILRAYNDARYQRETAEKELAVAEKELAPLIKEEEAAKIPYTPANERYQAVRTEAEPSRKAHEQAQKALTQAERKLETDCQKIDQFHEQLVNQTQTRCKLARRKLFETQKIVFRETLANGKKGPSRPALARRDAAKRELERAEAQRSQKARALLQVLQACQATADTENRAREAEHSAWLLHASFLAKIAEVEKTYLHILEEYQKKKQAADAVRTTQNTAKHQANTARKKIGELASAYQAIIQP